MHCIVAAAQMSLEKRSFEATIGDAKKLIRQAAGLGAQIVCLPEHWLLEHWKAASSVEEEISEAARADHIYVITGANYTRVGSTVHIRSTLVDADGGLLGWQDKIHLFRDEAAVATAGKALRTIQTPLGKIGITVCYDNVFPEAARTLALHGADLLFVPSRIVSEGMEPWLLYLKVRALENRVPVVATNIFHPPRYLGGSTIIDLEEEQGSLVVQPKVVAHAPAEEAVAVAEVNIDRARRLRSKRLSERVTSAYEI